MRVALARVLYKILPVSTASSLTRALVSLTQRQPPAAPERAAMAQATRLAYGDRARHVAWAWGSGPLVVFVHGWNGSAAQMAPLALRVAESGFRAVAIEVTGHGASPKRHTRWDYFLRDIAALSRSLAEPAYAYVGHSAGALTMMAARDLKGIRAQRYVCIATPSYPFPPLRVIQRKLNPKAAILQDYQAFIAGQFERTWEQLEAGCVFANLGPELLLIHDETDRLVPHDEADRIRVLCPGARVLKTHGYSHQGILSAPELAQATVDFLAKGPASP